MREIRMLNSMSHLLTNAWIVSQIWFIAHYSILFSCVCSTIGHSVQYCCDRYLLCVHILLINECVVRGIHVMIMIEHCLLWNLWCLDMVSWQYVKLTYMKLLTLSIMCVVFNFLRLFMCVCFEECLDCLLCFFIFKIFLTHRMCFMHDNDFK